MEAMIVSEFDYFPNFPEDAHLSADGCEYCGRSPAIPEVRLQPDPRNVNRKAVCADCLRADKARAKVPPWVVRDLAQAVDKAHADWSKQQRDDLVSSRIERLAHTPPVPWLQNNEWPVCSDDFAVYMGELTQDQLTQEYKTLGLAKAALRSVIEEVRPEWELDEEAVDTAWDQLGNFVAIFVFCCPGNSRLLYVLQTA